MSQFGKVFGESCERVTHRDARTACGKGFFDVFYEKFMGSSPVVAEKFGGVDMKRQKEMLRQSLACLLELFVTKNIPARLAAIAESHDRDHADIPPRLYESWLACLVETVREFDPEFDDEVELAWRLVCAPGIAYMVFRYDRRTANIPAAASAES